VITSGATEGVIIYLKVILIIGERTVIDTLIEVESTLGESLKERQVGVSAVCHIDTSVIVGEEEGILDTVLAVFSVGDNVRGAVELRFRVNLEEMFTTLVVEQVSVAGGGVEEIHSVSTDEEYFVE
jgi:hypothetical protein